MSQFTKDLGRRGEDLAAAFLLKKGWQIVRRNFVGVNKAEVDIIAQDGETLVFVEVKTFAENQWKESPAVNVTPSKQRQVIAGAKAYLMEIGREPYCRFDVLAVKLNDEAVIEHFEGAFTA